MASASRHIERQIAIRHDLELLVPMSVESRLRDVKRVACPGCGAPCTVLRRSWCYMIEHAAPPCSRHQGAKSQYDRHLYVTDAKPLLP